jgi:hypothetical protein
MSFGIDEIVDLHEVDAFDLKIRERSFHRVDSRLFAGGPNFRGEKKRLAQAEPGSYFADDFFGSPIHRRRIYDATSEFREKREHFFEGFALCGRRTDVEDLPCSKADDGKPFTRRWNGALQ